MQVYNLTNIVRLVVLHRGWVLVGRWSQEGDEVTLTGARCVRRWGTTKGLAQLVNGPTKSTELDAPATQRFHRLGVVLAIDCDPEKWTDALKP